MWGGCREKGSQGGSKGEGEGKVGEGGGQSPR